MSTESTPETTSAAQPVDANVDDLSRRMKRSNREIAADLAYMSYDFFGGEVCDDDGWEYTTPGNEWTRKIYMEPEDGDDEPGASMRLTFVVRFNEDDTVAEAYAIDTSGNIHGAATLTKE